MEVFAIMIAMLLPLSMIGYCLVRDRNEEEVAKGDPVKTYYLERQRWVTHEQVTYPKLWDGAPLCPSCRFMERMVDMDNCLEWIGPQESRNIRINPNDPSSPTVVAKYLCKRCGYMR